MRARNIKPGLWLNEELAETSISARYLFPGLWCAADKDGRLEYRPKKIKAELYPYDNVCVVSLIAELHGKKFISVYENEGFLYIQINNFVKHQNPHPKEKSNGYPMPVNICEYDGNLKQFIFTARNVQIPFPSSSLIPSSLIPEGAVPGQKRTQKTKFIPPTLEEVKAYCEERKNNIDPQYWIDSYTAKGWMVGKVKMKCWKSAIRTWEGNGFSNQSNKGSGNGSNAKPRTMREEAAAYRDSELERIEKGLANGTIDFGFDQSGSDPALLPLPE